jgi:hypothetical protein
MRNSRKGRFRVWDRSQDSFNGEDLVYNFDNLDELLGGPDGTSGASGNEFAGDAASWLGYGDVIPSLSSETKFPGTTNSGYEVQSGRRTLYSVVSGLNYNDVPLGTIITWWRPTSDVSIPDGWVPCDGRELSADQHSYSFAGTITVPDLRNKFVIGADAASPGINAFNGYALEGGAVAAQNSNNDWSGVGAAPGTTGAPGIGYDAALEDPSARTGDNTQRNISHNHGAGTLAIQDHQHSIAHTHTVPRHKHKVEAHSHDMTHVHLMPNHWHDFNTTDTFFSGQARVSASDGSESKITVQEGTRNRYKYPAGKDHVHRIDMNRAGATGERRNVDSPQRGLFNLGGWSVDLWGFPTDPLNMRSYRGYEFQAITSYPTHRRHSSTTLNAHEVKSSTGDYNPQWGSEQLYTGFSGSASSGEITTLPPTGSNANSGGITSDAGSKSLLGTTSQESIYVNIRPQYVGLLYLIKVRVSTNII